MRNNNYRFNSDYDLKYVIKHNCCHINFIKYMNYVFRVFVDKFLSLYVDNFEKS